MPLQKTKKVPTKTIIGQLLHSDIKKKTPKHTYTHILIYKLKSKKERKKERKCIKHGGKVKENTTIVAAKELKLS